MDSIRNVTVSWSLASRKAPLWIRRQPMMLVAHVGGCRGPLRVINRDANHDQDHFIQFTALVDFFRHCYQCHHYHLHQKPDHSYALFFSAGHHAAVLVKNTPWPSYTSNHTQTKVQHFIFKATPRKLAAAAHVVVGIIIKGVPAAKGLVPWTSASR